MRLDDALNESSGVINYSNRCLLCETNINWYAPVKSNYDVYNGRTLAKAEISKGLITSGAEQWADFDIVVDCPHCGVTNRFHGIKCKLKK